jgi:outer membrane protein assembly factor BamA
VNFSQWIARAALCVLFCACTTSAQTGKGLSSKLPPSASKLTSIKVTGNQNYTEDQIVRESGLRVGQTASDDDFKAASRILGETGAFTDVLYSFQYSGQGTKLTFQVTENAQLVPARFDNFVWFRDKEIMDHLHDTVPLFQGKLPVGGTLADQVSDELQALLVQKNIAGRVDYLRSAHSEGPIDAFIFRVTGPLVRVRSVAFSGASAAELPLLEPLTNHLKGAEYMRSILSVQAEKIFLPVYLSQGYLKAAFNECEAKVVEQTEDEVLVDVTFPVDPGPQYQASAVELQGAKSFPPATLRQLIHQQTGQPANSIQLHDDMEAIQQLYRTRGYMEASVEVSPQMDESHSTVQYLLQVHEGDVFKMGDLDVQGLDSRTTARMVDSWKLTGSDTYDSGYLKKFVQQALKDLNANGDWKVSIHETVNERDKTVDVSLRFDPK